MSAFLSTAFLLPFTVSLLVSWGIVWTRHWHGRYSFDSLSGVQKVHIGQVPRIGGMAIFLGFCSADIFLSNGAQSILNPLLLLGLIAFSFGLLEDLTKQVSVAMRLWATMIPGVVGYFLTGYTLNQFGYGWLDLLLSWPIVSIAFTATFWRDSRPSFGAQAMSGRSASMRWSIAHRRAAAGSSLWSR